MSLSKLPLLELPTVALNEVLKLFTPFEIICFSFCSKRTKSICQSIRTVSQCKKDLLIFNADFKLLIDKWRDGWTPNWKTMSIEFNEDIDVDTCVEGEFIDMEPEDYKSKKVVCGNFPIQFKGYFEGNCETTFIHGYHILRSDGMIVTIGISEDKYVGWFHIR
ncbi:hypothetical protein GCK72_020409 [Caenorhabditis remanei]|uniref:F-box domain-containing protein n=1 Tax=Caenorhabditis remanei TaxID=31234 RepID=A0A6A5GH67_CAERE|nr:hypothetical protein GCK72_020409 [Caenorhabditis remanei]KAF1753852.1 hypothetical protein GCK72_020409 [Caenorhabditis remanei]